MPTSSPMRAVRIDRPGPPEVLVSGSEPIPEIGAGEVLIGVRVAGVNRPDVLQRLGVYDPPPDASPLPGLEVAGEIVAVGDGARGVAGPWAVGDRVCALTPGGGYAEYCRAPGAQCLPIPDGVDMAEAAAIPETAFTVWHNMVERGGLSDGETILVHGGASGIGTTAIQIAKALGARVIATVRSGEKAEACRALGCDRAVVYTTEDFVEVARAETAGRGVDVVLDMVGGDYVPRNVDALASDGRHVSIAFLRDPKTTVSIAKIMAKRLILTGSTLRPQSIEAKARMAEGLFARVWPMIADGRFRPVMHARFPLDQAADAHRLMESNAHIGKIVLDVADPA